MKYKALIKEKMKNPKEAFKNEDGAIDLASIMVGIIVIGLIGGVIAATVFAVIPWTQDNAAKNQLESIHTAQNAYMGFSSAELSNLPAGAKQNTFASSSELATAELLAQNKNYCTAVPSDSKTYSAYSLSATGKIWTSNDKKAKPTVFSGTLPSSCADLIAASTAVGSTTPDGKTTYSYSPDGSNAPDISSPGKGDGTTAATSGTLSGDGSGSYFPASTAWLGPYNPPLSTRYLEAPKATLSGWSYNPSTNRLTTIFSTDGSVTGMGGSWEVTSHYDLSCYNPTTKVFTNYSGRHYVGLLKGPYSTTRPGPNSASKELPACPTGTVLSEAYLRMFTEEDRLAYDKSWLYTIKDLSEGWVNKDAPQQQP